MARKELKPKTNTEKEKRELAQKEKSGGEKFIDVEKLFWSKGRDEQQKDKDDETGFEMQDFPEGEYCSDTIADAYEKGGPEGALIAYKSMLKEMAEQPDNFIQIDEYMEDNPNTNPPPPPRTAPDKFMIIMAQAMAVATDKDRAEMAIYQAKIEENMRKKQDERARKRQDKESHNQQEGETEVDGNENAKHVPKQSMVKSKELAIKDPEPLSVESVAEVAEPESNSIVELAQPQDLQSDMPATLSPRTPILDAPLAGNGMETPQIGGRYGVNAPIEGVADAFDMEYGERD